MLEGFNIPQIRIQEPITDNTVFNIFKDLSSPSSSDNRPTRGDTDSSQEEDPDVLDRENCKPIINLTRLLCSDDFDSKPTVELVRLLYEAESLR